MVRLSHRRIELTVRPGASEEKRAEVMHEAVRELIARWEPRLGVHVNGYYLQRMKTRWGSCNHRAGHIRLNAMPILKPHEMLHLIEPTHSERFLDMLRQHYPTWREARAELNQLPLTAEVWRE